MLVHVAAANQEPFALALCTALGAAIGNADVPPHRRALPEAHIRTGLANGRTDVLHASGYDDAGAHGGADSDPIGSADAGADADADGMAVGPANDHA